MTKSKSDKVKSMEHFIELAELMHNPVMCKDTAGRYIFANTSSMHLFGFTSQQVFVGLNREMLKEKLSHQWQHDYDRTIHRMDHITIRKNIVTQDLQRAVPYQDGTLRIQNTYKKPIISPISGKVVAVFTFSHNLTPSFDLFHLFSVYCQYYSPKDAIHFFLIYLKIHTFFVQLPSKREFETILMLSTSGSDKSAANKMHISVSTLRENVSRIKNRRLKDAMLWPTLLEILRNDRTKNTVHPEKYEIIANCQN